MSNRILNTFIVYLYGAVAAAIGGFVTALGSYFGGQIIGAVDFTQRQIVAVAIAGAVTGVIGYFKTAPAPRLRVDERGNLDVDGGR